MAQDLLNISQEAFELQLATMSNSALMTVLKQIVVYKWENTKQLEIRNKLFDIERKHSKVERVLIERGYLHTNLYGQYNKWLRSINYKKKVF